MPTAPAKKTSSKTTSGTASKTSSKTTSSKPASKTSKPATKKGEAAKTVDTLAVAEEVKTAAAKPQTIKSPKEPKPKADGLRKDECTSPDGKLTGIVRWTKLKTDLIQTMQKMGITKAADAKSASEIAEASQGLITESQVMHQCKHKFCLVLFGFVSDVNLEGGKKGFYLTAKGKALKF